MSFDGTDKQPPKYNLLFLFLFLVMVSTLTILIPRAYQLEETNKQNAQEIAKYQHEISTLTQTCSALKQACKNWDSMYSEVYNDYITQKQIFEARKQIIEFWQRR